MSRTPITERIAHLLRKAESTTPQEAEALTEAASRLMIKHGIEQAVIEAEADRIAGRSPRREQVIKSELRFTGTHAPMWVRFINQLRLGYGSGLQLVQQTWHDRSVTVFIIGFESDVRAFLALSASLQQQAVTAQRLWWKLHEHKAWMGQAQRFRERRTFIEHFAYRVHTRMAAQRAEVEREVAAETGASTEVVLVRREEVIDTALAGFFPGAREARASRRKSGSRFAAMAGQLAGESANTGADAITRPAAVGG